MGTETCVRDNAHGRGPAWKVLRPTPIACIHERRPRVTLTVPLVSWCVGPFVLLDASIRLYRAACFRVYQIPRVRREDHFHFGRSHLPYPNALEQLHCFFCSYATGLASCLTEIVARTERHWCPIMRATALAKPHSRYGKSVAPNNAFAYREGLPVVRTDFDEIENGERERERRDAPSKR